MKYTFFYRNSIFKAMILLAAVTLTVYANSLANRFIMDDFLVIVQNDFIKNWHNFPAIFTKAYMTSPSDINYLGMFNIGSGEVTYRPVVTATYFLDYSIWKLNPFGYHLTNAALHLLNVVLLYFFICRITGNNKIGLFASLLFAVHPVNAEAVNCISFREELLAFLFFISSFMLYIKLYFYKGIKWFFCYAVSIAMYLLALFSKEMAISMPVLLMIYDYFFESDNRRFYFLKPRQLGYVISTFLYLFIWIFFKRYLNISLLDFSYQGGNFYTNALTMLRVLKGYITWLLFPVNVHLTLPDPRLCVNSILKPQAVFSLIIFAAVIFTGVNIRNKSKDISFGIFWFLAALFPVSNIIPIANIMASRYLYIPSVGYFLVASVLLYKLTQLEFSFFSKDILRRAAIEALIVVLLFYSMFTVIINVVWKNETGLWQKLVEEYPENSYAHRSLGDFFRTNNMWDRAIREYRISLRLNPYDVASYNGLGLSYYAKKMPETAIKVFKKALFLNSDSLAEIYNSLGNIFVSKKSYDEAMRYYTFAMAIDPRYILVYKNMGRLYIKTGKPSEARKIFQKALEINPGLENLKAKLKELDLHF